LIPVAIGIISAFGESYKPKSITGEAPPTLFVGTTTATGEFFK